MGPKHRESNKYGMLSKYLSRRGQWNITPQGNSEDSIDHASDGPYGIKEAGVFVSHWLRAVPKGYKSPQNVQGI